MSPKALLKNILFASLLGFILTSVITYPYVLNLKLHYPRSNDFLLNAWTYWYSANSIMNGELLTPQKFFTMNQLYPFPGTGAQLDFMVFPSLLLYLPTHLLFRNPVLSVNFTLFTLFILNFVSAYICLFLASKHKFASVIGAIIFTFYPGIVNHTSGHTEYLGRFLIPPFFLLFYRYLYYPTKKLGFWLVFTYFLSWFTSIQITIFLTIFALLGIMLFIAHNIIQKTFSKEKIFLLIKHSALPILLFLPVLIYFFYPYIKYSNYEGIKRDVNEAAEFSADPIDYFLPTPNNLLFGRVSKIFEPVRYTPGGGSFNYAEHTLTPGYIAIILFFVFSYTNLIKNKILFNISTHSNFVWISNFIMMVFAIVFSFGPYLGQGVTYVKLPYYYLHQIFPLLYSIRTPTRIQYVAVFFVSYIITQGLAEYFRSARKIKPAVVAAIITILILAEYLNRTDLDTRPIKTINYDFNNKVVLFLPIRSGLQLDGARYLTQHVTNNLISINGSTGSEQSIQGYKYIRSLLTTDMFSDNWFGILKNLGVTYVVIDKTEFSSEKAGSQEIPKDLTGFGNALVYNDQNWAVIDAGKLDATLRVPCKDKNIGSTNIGLGIFYRFDGSIYMNYNFENTLGCDLVFVGDDRYVKVSYKTLDPFMRGETKILLRPIILNKESDGGRIELIDKTSKMPSKVLVTLNDTETFEVPLKPSYMDENI